MGDMACFSLQQSKHVTCGEGGLMVTRSAEFARTAGLFADKAWPRDINHWDRADFYFFLKTIACLNCKARWRWHKFEKCKTVVSRRRQAAESLSSLLGNVAGVTVAVYSCPDETLLLALHAARDATRRWGAYAEDRRCTGRARSSGMGPLHRRSAVSFSAIYEAGYLRHIRIPFH